MLKWSTLLWILLWIYWEIAPINISVQHEVPSVLLASCDSIISFRTVPLFFFFFHSVVIVTYSAQIFKLCICEWMKTAIGLDIYSTVCFVLSCLVAWILFYHISQWKSRGDLLNNLLLRFAYQIAIKYVK